MKTYVVLLIGLLLTMSAVQAQNDSLPEEEKEFKFEWGPGNQSDEIDFVETRWILFDLGSTVLTSDETYSLPQNDIDPFEQRIFKSTNVNLHLVRQRMNIIKGIVNLEYGLGFGFYKIMFENPVKLVPEQPQVTFEYNPETDYKKTRLSYSYLQLPLMLSFETKPEDRSKSFHISAGGYFGVRTGANHKTKMDGDKDKKKDDFNINSFQYGLRAQLGYGPFNLYATYRLDELFDPDKDNGYELHPFSIGVILLPF